VSWRPLVRRIGRPGLPAALLYAAARPRASVRDRSVATALLLLLWGATYTRYRRLGKRQTAHEFELLQTADWEAFTRHYNERVPTVEEEFDIWGEYHAHRHEMRYDLVAAAVRRHLPDGGAILDIGSGSAMLADRLADVPALYVGAEFGGHQVGFAAAKDRSGSLLHAVFAQADAEHLPFPDAAFDVVVMSEVIEHLLRPDVAVWEVARLLRPGGHFVMTTNNASEVPLRSPLSHLPAWLEKALGANRPHWISLRPWVWPVPVDRALVPPGESDVYLPHTHHILGETRRLFAAAGLDTVANSTFEFPPPQSELARWLEGRGQRGRQVVDVIEAVARRVPLVNRLGCHLFMVARKARSPVSDAPPPGVWPGPFSGPCSSPPAHEHRRRPERETAAVADRS
jgi:SAM-dependent methyltransferase